MESSQPGSQSQHSDLEGSCISDLVLDLLFRLVQGYESSKRSEPWSGPEHNFLHSELMISSSDQSAMEPLEGWAQLRPNERGLLSQMTSNSSGLKWHPWSLRHTSSPSCT